MPWYMKSLMRRAQHHQHRDKGQVAAEEVMLYNRLGQSIRALIAGCEPLMKTLTVGQHRLLEGMTSLSGLKKGDNDDTSANPRFKYPAIDLYTTLLYLEYCTAIFYSNSLTSHNQS